MQKKLFLAGRRANFYQTDITLRETRFRVEPKTAKEKGFMEQMNGTLGLLHQHMRLQQYKVPRFIPKVTDFDTTTGRLTLTIAANLATAIPTALIDYNNVVIDQRNATWITQQAFQLASLANGAGIVLPFSTENFLICYKSESFALFDWTMAQCYADNQTKAMVAQSQVVDLAGLLIAMVDYRGITSGGAVGDSRLWDFIQRAIGGMFPSATEAMQVLNTILS